MAGHGISLSSYFPLIAQDIEFEHLRIRHTILLNSTNEVSRIVVDYCCVVSECTWSVLEISLWNLLPLWCHSGVFHKFKTHAPHVTEDTIVEVLSPMDINSFIVLEGGVMCASFWGTSLESHFYPVLSICSGLSLKSACDLGGCLRFFVLISGVLHLGDRVWIYAEVHVTWLDMVIWKAVKLAHISVALKFH